MRILSFIYLCLLAFPILAQVSEGGSPLSYSSNSTHNLPYVVLDTPEIPDDQGLRSGSPEPYQIAEGISADIDLARDGKWFYAPDGRRYLALGVSSGGAKALIFYYKKFRLPEGGRLFIYAADHTQLIGAFTSENNASGGYFATEAVRSDKLVLEYDPGNTSILPEVVIYQVHYVYRELDLMQKGPSGPCEVNINCMEGDSWQNEKRSVAKIVLKSGSGTYLCTGSLINNVRQDSTPYFLTARHCGNTASLSDYSQWVFHFNYEALNCEDPIEDPPSNTIVGSSLVAESPYGTSVGSDFKLLLLSQDIPESYSPYFSGWSRENYASPSGVCIHHPRGDIKKVSTYISPLISSQYGSGGTNPDGMYWRVVWAETENGHGVTEGGSSGSPIFDNTGKIVGTLTGGGASCEALTEPDFYGKFSYHWDQNGSPGDAQLKPYLDPDHTGANSLGGFGYGSRLIANFDADTTTISIGGRISFNDKSDGDPESWQWAFSGGNPSGSTQQDPGTITYNNYGHWDVRLVVSSGISNDTILRKEYIRVTPNLYPNPTNSKVTVDFGSRQVEYIDMEAYDIYGRMVGKYENSGTTTGVWTISVSNLRAGNYMLRIKTNVQEDVMPLIVY